MYDIFSDARVNEFLPWFPVKTRQEALAFYKERFESKYRQIRAYNYAVCLKENDRPIGYVNVGMDDSYDFGYGLRSEFWHRGLATEAGRAVIRRLKTDGIPYITATHDVNNPRSGNVMRRLGMKYRYSYVEQWMPKNIQVTFRMYQLNLDLNFERVYLKYWDNSPLHFIEEEL